MVIIYGSVLVWHAYFEWSGGAQASTLARIQSNQVDLIAEIVVQPVPDGVEEPNQCAANGQVRWGQSPIDF
jgi:hypothetical protein